MTSATYHDTLWMGPYVRRRRCPVRTDLTCYKQRDILPIAFITGSCALDNAACARANSNTVLPLTSHFRNAYTCYSTRHVVQFPRGDLSLLGLSYVSSTPSCFCMEDDVFTRTTLHHHTAHAACRYGSLPPPPTRTSATEPFALRRCSASERGTVSRTHTG